MNRNKIRDISDKVGEILAAIVIVLAIIASILAAFLPLYAAIITGYWIICWGLIISMPFMLWMAWLLIDKMMEYYDWFESD